MNRLTVAALRVLLVILFLGTVTTQLWFVPQFAREAAEWYPMIAYLAAPYAIVWIAIVANVQVALISIWMLLGKVRRGAIFTDSAFLWVNGIIAAGSLATVLVVGFGIHMIGIVDVGNPPLAMVLGGLILAGVAFTLVMVVMRGLLRQATQLQTELEEVV